MTKSITLYTNQSHGIGKLWTLCDMIRTLVCECRFNCGGKTFTEPALRTAFERKHAVTDCSVAMTGLQRKDKFEMNFKYVKDKFQILSN